MIIKYKNNVYSKVLMIIYFLYLKSFKWLIIETMHYKDGNRAKVMARSSWRKEWRSNAPKTKRAPLLSEPQFSLDSLYISPFGKEQVTDERGFTGYVDIKPNLTPTGIHIFDEYLQWLWLGKTSQEAFCKRHGIRISDLNVMTFLLTGVEGLQFRTDWMMRTADLLLRYTNLTTTQIARLSGIGSRTNLYICYQRERNYTPTDHRERTRLQNDLQRYKLTEEWANKLSNLK